MWELPSSIADFNLRWLSLVLRGDRTADAALAEAAQRLDPAVAMLQADPPEMDTYDNHGLVSAGGGVWAQLARHGGDPQLYWPPIRDHVRGFLVPAAEMRAVLRGGALAAGGSLSRPLRFAPALLWRTGQRVEADPERWQRDLTALLAGWPGPLTLVLSGTALGFFEGDGRMVLRSPWRAVLDVITRIEAPNLVGLELSGLPVGGDFFSRLCRAPWFPQLRSLLLAPHESFPWDLSALFSARPGGLETLVLGAGVADDQLLHAPIFANLRQLECAGPSFPAQPLALPAGLESLAVREPPDVQDWPERIARVSGSLRELFLLDVPPHLLAPQGLLSALAASGLTTLGLSPSDAPDRALEALEEALSAAPRPSALTTLWLPEPCWGLPPAARLSGWLGDASLREDRGWRTRSGRWLWAEGDLRL